MSAPSNANTSGLEVVAWRWTDGDAHYSAVRVATYEPQRYPHVLNPEPLVTAASAQARIAELERDKEELARTANEWTTEAHERLQKVEAAEARADRLAKALERIAEHLCAVEPHKSETAVQWAEKEARAALQQETQP